ncbi:MAG: ParA family protein [Anaerolineaceae bacterium]|jgi:chromosome partitioning protein|nr:ParA family protein [Anaerolineaceae bacterium]
MTRVIAIANEKGGVAKTTTALSLGGALVALGYRVLLVDLDPQANLSLAMGCESHAGTKSFINLVMENLNLERALVKTEIQGLYLLPANKEIRFAERVLPTRPEYRTLLRNIIAQEKSYDFVLIDCPPFIGTLTTNALTAANLLIIPTQAEYFSVYALRNMMSLIREVRSKGNPALRYRLLVTLFDKRNRIHRTLYSHLRQTFIGGVLDSIIEVDTKLRESVIAGVPINHLAGKSRAAMQYDFLAQEIIQYVKE